MKEEKELTEAEKEGIRRLKAKYAREWRKRNKERLYAYNKAYREKHDMEEAKQRHWLKKLEQEEKGIKVTEKEANKALGTLFLYFKNNEEATEHLTYIKSIMTGEENGE